MLNVSVSTSAKDVQRSLDALARKQLPFATAKALTAVAKRVQADEQKAMKGVLDRPTPFTVNAVAVKGARKSDLQAVVYVRDIAAKYLEPFEFGGDHKLIGKGITWLNPKNGLPLNQYGNLTKSMLARLKGRSDVFVGKVKTKNGEVISGVWQRPYIRANQKVRGVSRRNGLVNHTTNTTGRLKLLMRFGDEMPVKQHLNYRVRAKQTINAIFDAELSKAMTEALATAKLK